MFGEQAKDCINFAKNFEDEFDIAGDITKIEAVDVPGFDICLAGFPCQAFSLAGARKGFEDDYKGLCRGTLFLDVARICEKHKPKVIFCENVKGLVVHDKKRTFQVIKKSFEDILEFHKNFCPLVKLGVKKHLCAVGLCNGGAKRQS